MCVQRREVTGLENCSVMGVDIVSYRCRIGAFAMSVRSRRRNVQCDLYCPVSEWDYWTDLSVRMILCTVWLLAMYGYGMCWKALLTSNCVQSVSVAMMGRDVPEHDAMQPPRSSATNVGYDVDLSGLLLLGGDVELNPGPVEREDMAEIVAGIVGEHNDKLMQKMTEMAVEMKKISSEVVHISQKLSDVERELNTIRNKMEAHEAAIDSLEDERDDINRALKEVEERLEEREVRDRRDNILLHGVHEAEGIEHENCEETFVNTVNAVLPEPITVKDIVRAHRIGKYASGKSRPLIAKMTRSADKLAILRKRDDLKKKGLGVSGDLTVKQREELRQARSDGYFAFFKGGKLHTEERRPQHGSDRPVTRSHSRAHPWTSSVR